MFHWGLIYKSSAIYTLLIILKYKRKEYRMPKKVFNWEKLRNIGDSFVIEKCDKKKKASCRFSARTRGMILKFFPRPNGDCEVVYSGFDQDMVDKYKNNVTK